MTKPTILAVDDDPGVLASITRDLRSRYGQDYRIVRASSGPQALEVLAELALRARPVALIASESLLGGKYMSLQPGGDPDPIQPGGRIDFTQSTPGLEQLLGQVIFSMQQGGQQNSQQSDDQQGEAPQPGASSAAPATPGGAASGGLLGN